MRNNFVKILVSALLIALPFWLLSQEYRMAKNSMSDICIQKLLEESDTIVHFAIQPLWLSKKWHQQVEDELINGHRRNSKKRFIGRKLFDEHFFDVSGEGFSFQIDPLLEVGGGRDLEANETKNLTTNIRGIQLQGNISKKLSFYTSYYESQSSFPEYIDTLVRSTRVVPGSGRVKIFEGTAYDYSLVFGSIRYKSSDHIQLMFGQDRLFIGHGYRSVLLSDNSFTYPMFSLNLVGLKNKLQYHTTWAWLQLQERTPKVNVAEPILKRKQANFHYLSFKPNNKIELGLFEGVIWKRWDEQEGSINVNTTFYVPVMFASQLTNPDKEEYNQVTGFNALVQPIKHFNLYGQVALNDRDNAFQVGVKWNSPFQFKSWFVQTEYNNVGEEIYAVSEYQNVNYNHYNQSLTTPLSGYSEIVTALKFHKNYWWADGKINLISLDNDQSGIKSIQILQGELGYIINPKYNLMVYVGGLIRNPDIGSNTFWGFAGIKTNLTNRYFDF